MEQNIGKKLNTIIESPLYSFIAIKTKASEEEIFASIIMFFFGNEEPLNELTNYSFVKSKDSDHFSLQMFSYLQHICADAFDLDDKNAVVHHISDLIIAMGVLKETTGVAMAMTKMFLMQNMVKKML